MPSGTEPSGGAPERGGIGGNRENRSHEEDRLTHYFGAHTNDKGGMDMAVRRAAAGGMRAMQLFTAIPKFYGDRSSVRAERAERFRIAIAETKLDPRFVMAHAAYVLNTAAPDPAQWARARDGLAKELERCTTLGIGQCCFHPGAATDGNRDAAAERVAAAIVFALERVPGDARVLVENSAGAGTTFGRAAAEVGDILARVPGKLRGRTGYGLDTCHLFASGYAIHESSDALVRVLDEFEEATGEPPSFFHLNDSEHPLGTNRDRHVLIGDGHIGAEPFRWLLHDRRSRGIPLLLETPHLVADVADDDPAPDPYDAQMLALLEGLAAPAH